MEMGRGGVVSDAMVSVAGVVVVVMLGVVLGLVVVFDDQRRKQGVAVGNEESKGKDGLLKTTIDDEKDQRDDAVRGEAGWVA